MATTIAAGSTYSLYLPVGSIVTLTGLGFGQFAPNSTGVGAIRPIHVIGAAPVTTRADSMTINADPGGPGVFFTVTAVSDTVAASQSGACRPRRPSCASAILSKSFQGRYLTAATSGADNTTSYQFGLEADYDAVRIIIPNPVTAAVTGVKAAITAGQSNVANAGTNGSAAAIDPTANNTLGTWSTLLWSGAGSVTLPAGTSLDVPSYTASDWMKIRSVPRADGGTQPLLWLRIFVPGAGNANAPASYHGGLGTTWDIESSCAGRLIRMRGQGVDGVGTINSFTTSSTPAYFNCPVIVQYLSRKTGLTVLVVGDSIDEGTGATDQLGWHYVAKHAVSTKDSPIELCVQAIAGANSATWLSRLNACIAAVTPDYVSLPIYEVNDQATPMASFGIMTSQFNAELAKKAALDNRAVPIIRTGNPSTVAVKAFTATDSLRQNLNDQMRLQGSAINLMDSDAVLAGDSGSNGQRVPIASLDADGIHPNDAGHLAIAQAQAIPLFRRLLSANSML
jgi:lysophospholipase L1-like esterase